MRFSPALSLGLVTGLLTALMAAGCASTRLDAQWVDPQFAGRPLAGAKVLVVCSAAELTVKRLCQERMAAEVTALGATAVPGPDQGGPGPDAYLGAARSVGARAVLVASVAPDANVVSSAPSVSFGLGGFNWGGGSSVGGGVGVSMPVGNASVKTAYGANTSLTDVATGKLMWTGKASTPAQDDLGAQIGELSRATLGAAQKAGLF